MGAICGLNKPFAVWFRQTRTYTQMRHDAFMFGILGVVIKLWFLYHNLKRDQQMENLTGPQKVTQKSTELELDRDSNKCSFEIIIIKKNRCFPVVTKHRRVGLWLPQHQPFSIVNDAEYFIPVETRLLIWRKWCNHSSSVTADEDACGNIVTVWF